MTNAPQRTNLTYNCYSAKVGRSHCKSCNSVVSVVSTFYSSFPVRPQVKLTLVLVATKWSRCTVKLLPIFPVPMSRFISCTRHVQRDVNITAVRYAVKILLQLRASVAYFILCIQNGQREFNMSYRAKIDYIEGKKTACFRMIHFVGSSRHFGWLKQNIS